MRTVLLISGKLQSGKNQLSIYIKDVMDKMGFNIIEDSFAKDLKDNCADDFAHLKTFVDAYCEELDGMLNDLKLAGSDPEKINAISKKVNSLKFTNENFYEDKTELTRVLLQIYGTEIFRNRVDNSYWSKQVSNRCMTGNYNVTHITDVRFPDEIMVVENDSNIGRHTKYKVVKIRVERDSLNRDDTKNQHISETSLDDYNKWDDIVYNNGSLEDLKTEALKLVHKHLLS